MVKVKRCIKKIFLTQKYLRRFYMPGVLSPLKVMHMFHDSI